MGTRNITSVIMNGKQVVCQYGQWDGYPSYTGTKILEFLRDSDLSKLKKALENTTITVSDYEKSVSYTGSTKDYGAYSELIYDAKRELNEAIGEWPNFEQLYTYLMQKGTIAETDLENYFVWTRDTGCDILPLIYNRSLDKPPLELAAMSHDFNGDYAWDIQGIYIVNLDDRTVKMTFDKYSCDYDLNALPVDIEKSMLIFEKATDILYAFRKDDRILHVGTHESGFDQDMEGLLQLSLEASNRIFTELKDEYPDLFFDQQSQESAEQEIQDYTYTMLCRKVGLEASTTKSLDAIIHSADSRASNTPDCIDNAKDYSLDGC